LTATNGDKLESETFKESNGDLQNETVLGSPERQAKDVNPEDRDRVTENDGELENETANKTIPGNRMWARLNGSFDIF
jgi:hypothetical protein